MGLDAERCDDALSYRVRDWLLHPAFVHHDPIQQDLLMRPKRKTAMSELDTPRQKRLRLGTNLQTLPSSTDSTFSEPPTLTSSRSSSPTKKDRQIEAEFSKPAHKLHPRLSAKRWKEKNTRQIPLFDSLQRAINDDSAPPVDVQLQLREILDKIEQCKERGGTEDMWSDTVVYPTLCLAQRISKWRDYIDVINVKSIDVNPIELLPGTSSNRPKKRIDYVIGLRMDGDDDDDDNDGIWRILDNADNHTVTQSTSKMIRDRALCANIEIKTGDAASEEEANLQHFAWCAAGFAKQEKLWLARERRRGAQQQRLTRLNAEQLAPLPLWLWTRNSVEVFVAVMNSAKERVDVLAEQRFVLDADDPASLVRIVNALLQVMNWGCEEYLPWFKQLLGEEFFK